jgi:CDP-6-deoxy-D-xylo-4-hexulose-3-dehydrase
VVLAHALGNPFDVAAVTRFCRAHDLWLIEDNCDALGSRYALPGEAARLTGTFGDLSTQSFYPPHHITMGEGGAVNIGSDMRFKVIVESFRDWGRDCWCDSGKDNTCGKRFGWKLGELPTGYDHKYTYSHLGYNLKPLDVQAAVGRVQLGRLPQFVAARRANWQRLREGLAPLSEFFEFMEPTLGSEPSWFGFMLLVRDGAPFTAVELSRHLDARKVGNRRLFGGNLVRQPAFIQLRKDNPKAFRVVGSLGGADRLMQSALFVGVYPGLTGAMVDYVMGVIGDFCRRTS